MQDSEDKAARVQQELELARSELQKTNDQYEAEVAAVKAEAAAAQAEADLHRSKVTQLQALGVPESTVSEQPEAKAEESAGATPTDVVSAIEKQITAQKAAKELEMAAEAARSLAAEVAAAEVAAKAAAIKAKAAAESAKAAKATNAIEEPLIQSRSSKSSGLTWSTLLSSQGRFKL